MIETERTGTSSILDLVQEVDLSTDLGHVLVRGRRGRLWKTSQSVCRNYNSAFASLNLL